MGKPIDLICPECQRTFIAHKKGNYYCSNKCWAKANKYKIAERKTEWSRARKFVETGSPLYAPINKKATEFLKFGVIS